MTTSPANSEVATTLNSEALTRLRSDILNCRLMPNERLRVEALRERYGMGTSPIREALMRLEAEGLVALEQNKGFRVSDVSAENLIDLMSTRIEIEGIALRWSLKNGGVDWEANLVSAFHRLSRQEKFELLEHDQRGLEQGTRELPRRAGGRLRRANSVVDPRAAVRTSGALCRAVNHGKCAVA